jgi:hypothetical protein
MFYRAVERIRPRLCERFVFMTGYRNDARANEFIKSINGYVLQKPFQLKDLMDAIALAEVRGTFQTVFDSDLSERAGSQVCPPADPNLGKTTPRLRSTPGAAEADPSHPPAPIETSAPRRRAWVPSRSFAFTALAPLLCLALAANLVGGFRDARKRTEAALAERRALEVEWAAVAMQREHAEQVRPKVASVPKQEKRIAAERNAVEWMDALRAISRTAGPEIDFHRIKARGGEGSGSPCEIHLEVLAAGRAPRLVADRFFAALRRELEGRFPGRVVANLTRLEDEPEPAAAAQPGRASMSISVQIGSSGAKGAVKK